MTTLHVPKHYPGYKLSGGGAVLFELFIDLQCSHSKKAFSVLKQLVQAYPKGDVTFYAIPICQPQHRQSFLLAKACALVCPDGNRDGAKWLDFATALFDAQHLFTNDACREKSESEIAAMVADLICKWGKLAATQVDVIKQKLLSDSALIVDAKWGTKLATLMNIGFVTPTYVVNGFPVPNAADAFGDANAWKAALNPLISAAK